LVNLIITFSHSFHIVYKLEKISGIVRHHWKEIEKSETLAKLFPEPPVVAFRQPKSIKDTLIRAAVSRPSSTDTLKTVLRRQLLGERYCCLWA
jgi:hypothetical protein